MKLNRLASTTQQHTQDAIERAHYVASSGVRRVEAQEGIEGDRQRSLQQELAEFDLRAIGPFEGGHVIMEDARRVAAQLILLGSNIDGLVKLHALSEHQVRIDDKV